MRLADLRNLPTVTDDTADADALELDDARVELRYESQDPTLEELAVRVPCPHSESCLGPAWVPVSTVDELVKAVEGTSVDVPWCERCDEE